MSAEDLASRICNLVADGGEEGVLQSDLWKMLGLGGRGCSRIVVDLERRRIIRREKVLGGDRWTYKLMPLWRPAKSNRSSSVRAQPALTTRSVLSLASSVLCTVRGSLNGWSMNSEIIARTS